MVALVTGAAGFIGKHLCAELEERDWTVRRVDLEYGDDLAKMSMDLVGWVRGVDTVFHLAAQSDVREADPHLTFRNGVLATHHILEAMRVEGVRYLVYTSSGSVYGDRGSGPLTELNSLLPNSPYAGGKAAAEMLIGSYAAMYEIQPMILRLSNVVGSGMKRGVIYDFIHKLISDPECLHVLGNGDQLKSYVHVRDVVEAILHLDEHPRGWDVFNVAAIDRVSVSEIASLVAEEMDLHPTMVYDASPIGWPGDIPQVDLFTGKIRKLGWTARYGSHEAVRRTIATLVREIMIDV